VYSSGGGASQSQRWRSALAVAAEAQAIRRRGAQAVNHKTEQLREKNQRFFDKEVAALRGLFEAAKARNELHFALSLNPEFRGMRDPGWSSAQEVHAAFDDYLSFLQDCEPNSLKTRIALGFYCHLAEASGFYEIPKNMLRVAEGQQYNLEPFDDLVERNRRTGNRIAPNANKIIRDLVGHAENLEHHELAEVFRDAFDPDVRNAYSHADYVVWVDSIRFGVRHGPLREFSYPQFTALFERGAHFFEILRQVVHENVVSYSTPAVIRGYLADEPERNWTISYDSEKGVFSISG
jgi:hypothetical protein